MSVYRVVQFLVRTQKVNEIVLHIQLSAATGEQQMSVLFAVVQLDVQTGIARVLFDDGIQFFYGFAVKGPVIA